MAGDYDFKTTSFELKGFKELYRALDHLPEFVKKAELEPLVIDALIPMMVTAIRLAPDDSLTGPPWNLPTSIDISTRQRSGPAKHDRQLGRFDARAYMGPTKYGYPQAIFAEFGTGARYQKSTDPDRYVGVMVATPYMRPAWDTEKHGALKILADRMGERLTLIARKYGVKG